MVKKSNERILDPTIKYFISPAVLAVLTVLTIDSTDSINSIARIPASIDSIGYISQ